jgi:hypothetical protein
MTKGARFSLLEIRKENLSRKPWSDDVTSTDLSTEGSIILKRRLKGTMGDAINLKQTLLKLPSLSREISWLMVGNKYKNTMDTKKDKSNLDLRLYLRSKKRTLYVANKSVRPFLPCVGVVVSGTKSFAGFSWNSVSVLFTKSSQASASFVKIGLSKSYFTSGRI